AANISRRPKRILKASVGLVCRPIVTLCHFRGVQLVHLLTRTLARTEVLTPATNQGQRCEQSHSEIRPGNVSLHKRDVPNNILLHITIKDLSLFLASHSFGPP